jgi:hypothetical protein
MVETQSTFYSVAAEECLRCGACSTLAPGIIAMGERAAVFERQPATARERVAAEAALFNCPMLAIRKRSRAA